LISPANDFQGAVDLRILVLGARGFIGRHVAATLTSRGHEVVRGQRHPPASTGVHPTVQCDFAHDTDPATWIPRLTGVDAVINCAGILRERGPDRFEPVHVSTPKALYSACARAGVRRIIQISALGDDRDGEFIASKHRGDANLARSDLDWIILRPSVVYSARGSYGGTSLLRAMSALPFILALPGNGQQRVQPVDAEDLADLTVWLLDNPALSRQILAVVGPEVMTIEAYLRMWRGWLGISSPWIIHSPLVLVAMIAHVAERIGHGPLGLTMYRMLARGNTADSLPAAQEQYPGAWTPKSLRVVLDEQPSFIQDRWHARLYFLAPTLRISLAVVWLASAAVGFLTPRHTIQVLLEPTGVARASAPLVYVASLIDLVLGAWLLTGRRTTAAGVLMLISLFSYTAFIGVTMPSVWMEPFGGLLKNLALIPTVMVMMVLADRK
jgi:uncharacterized protein YbjT (DUF2867 family)